RFTDAQRICLGRKAKLVGRRSFLALATIVTPDTLLHWFRTLVAGKRTTPGRPIRGPADAFGFLTRLPPRTTRIFNCVLKVSLYNHAHVFDLREDRTEGNPFSHNCTPRVLSEKQRFFSLQPVFNDCDPNLGCGKTN